MYQFSTYMYQCTLYQLSTYVYQCTNCLKHEQCTCSEMNLMYFDLHCIHKISSLSHDWLSGWLSGARHHCVLKAGSHCFCLRRNVTGSACECIRATQEQNKFLILWHDALRHMTKSFYMHFRSHRITSQNIVNQALHHVHRCVNDTRLNVVSVQAPICVVWMNYVSSSQVRLRI